MTAIELNTQKVNLIKDILDETNEVVILELVTYFRQVRKKKSPCSFTDTEKKERIEQSVRVAGVGLGITQETMINRHHEWI
ncbi:MAG: hypothetical protein PHT07_09020 [Paludibacter sp.]|nr:hypothetical protein [Paludibacter sp.]